VRLFLFTAITTLLMWGSAYAQGPSLSNIKALDDVEPAAGSTPPIETAHPDLYKALNDKLDSINRELANYDLSSAIPQLSFQKSVIKEGDWDPNMPLLRARMVEYLPTEAFDTDLYLYDQFLSEAVKAYQIKHALKSDGIIGPQTLVFMNKSLLDKKKQIEINLFRLQQEEWQSRPPLRIDVDVARYSLTAYEEGEVAFQMPVVVGSQARQTNIFSTVMTGVRINPGWTLPPTIKAEDYIPKLRTTPEWVTQQGVMIFASWEKDAQPIDPTTVDWNFLSDNDIKAMRFYKNAGDENPLGRYRFLMNNQHDIYLHDTNQKYLFNRSARAYSSGCVRVYDPRKITEFLLKDNPDWTPDKIDNVLEAGETYNIRAKRSIPVYFDYKTAWLNNDGDLILGHDIYGMDETVYNQMQDSQKTLED
jgi:murein L,D-transpeptidase YcbB/YkuD